MSDQPLLEVTIRRHDARPYPRCEACRARTRYTFTAHQTLCRACVWELIMRVSASDATKGTLMSTKWAEVDWMQTDEAIARDLGVTKQRVHQVRKKLNMPRAQGFARRQSNIAKLAATRTTREIADELGLASGTVAQHLRALGIEAVRGPRATQSKHDWDSVAWERKTDTMIAEELGTAPAVVSMRRRRFAYPDGPDGRVPSTWTPEVIEWKRERGLLPRGWE